MVNFAYSYLDGFFRSPHDAPPKWLFAISQIEMYTAYLDETGQQTNGWVFVAGFLGNEKHWKSFIPRWKEEMGPRRQRLHMHKLRWKKPHTKELLARLGPVPAECGLTAVVGGVKCSDYEDLVKGSVVAKLAEGYLHSLFPLVLTMLKYLPDDERVELIFGAQDRYKERALDLLSFIASETKGDSRFCTKSGLPKLAKWSYVPSDSTILLDPSDYYAYALAKYYHDKTSERAQWCRPIIDSSVWVGKILNREEIRGQITRNRQRLLSAGVQFYG